MPPPAHLRAVIADIEATSRRRAGRLPVAEPELDFALGGGLALGRWHHLRGVGMDQEEAAAPAGFALSLHSLRHAAPLVWIAQREDFYPPALAGLGAPPDLVCVRTSNAPATLQAVEDALATSNLMVIAELDTLSLTAGRRLQLAAERGGGLGLIVERRRGSARPFPGAGAAASRWRIAAAPTDPPGGRPGLGPCRWQVELEHCRGGRPGSWVLELQEDAHGAHPFRLVAPLADHGLDTPARRPFRAYG